MKKLLLIITILMVEVIFSEPTVIQWERDFYTLCDYDTTSHKYNINCDESTEVVNITIRRHLDTISIGSSIHLIDSLWRDVNSTGDSLIYFKTKNISSNTQTIIAIGNTYINIIVPNKWKLFIHKTEESILTKLFY